MWFGQPFVFPLHYMVTINRIKITYFLVFLPLNKNSTQDNISDNPRLHFYQLVYGILVVVTVVLAIIDCFFYTGLTLNAACKLHNTMFKNVMCKP